MAVIIWVRNWWNKSLRNRLLASSIMTMLLFLVLQGYLSFRIGRTGVLNEVNQRNDKLAAVVAKDVDGQLNNIWSNVRLLTYQLEAGDGVLPLQAGSMLALRLASPLTYRALYLFDREGHLLIHLTDPLEALLAIGDVLEILNRGPIRLTNEVSAAQEALMRSGDLFVSAVSIVGADQIPVVYVGMPVFVKQGQSRQSIVAEVDLRDIWRRVDRVSVGPAGRAFVVSRSGTIIAHPDRSYVGRALPAELEQVLAGYEGQTEYFDPVSKRTMLASYSPVGGKSGWGIVVEQERDEAFVPVNRIASTALVVLLVAVGIAIAVSSLIARNITRPIQQLEEATETIGRTGDLTHNIAVEGQDEVSHLATTFNRMIASLREAERKLKLYSGQLEGRVKERTAELEAANIQLKELDRLKSMFIASMSHELRTPLNSIIGFTGIILQGMAGEINEEQRRQLSRVKNSANHLLALIIDVIDVSKIEAGKVELLIEEFDLSALAREVENSFKVAAEEKELEISLKMSNGLTIKNDERRTKQVLVNLVGNAVKFTDKGKIEIKVTEKDRRVEIAVRDTGIGIRKEEMERLFKAFSQISNQDRPKQEGTGLGLYLSRKILDLLGGEIKAESEFGKGSVFTFTLPLKYEGVTG